MKKTRLVAAVFVLCVCLTVSAPAFANAWAWSDGGRSISSQLISDYSDPHQACTAPSEVMNVSGVDSPQPVCLLEAAPNTEVGTYANGQIGVVRFGQDQVAYPLINCKPVDCLYDPAQDSIITKQHVINNIVSSLVIYRHASQRLKRMYANNAAAYGFDLSNPDYVDWNTDGYALPIGAFAVSANGRWLAMEYYNNGFGVMDMATLAMTKVSTTTFYYGGGMDPSLELAIANNGQVIAVTGSNAVDLLIEVSPGCGFDPLHEASSVPTCEVASPDVVLRSLQNGYSYTTRPYLNDNASQLVVASVYWPSVVRITTIRTTPTVNSSLSYLGIGDSYTSGEGEIDDSHYLTGTNDPHEKCHTSDRSYPYLVATLEGSHDIHSIACSGARITDIESSFNGYTGQSGRLGAQGLALNADQLASRQLAALSSFVPGEVPQAYFVDRYQPQVLMVGIGGNDAGFMDKMRACMMPDECEWVSQLGKAQAKQEIESLRPKLTSLYKDLHQRSPSSRIYAIGYPQIINPDGTCDALTSFMFDYAERQFIKDSLDYIDQIIAAAAYDAGISYVNVENAYGEHIACGGSDKLAVNELQLGNDVAPVNLLPRATLFGDETFHPTPLGHQLVAAAIHQQFPNLAQGSSLCLNAGCVVTPQSPSGWSSPPSTQAIAQQLTPSPVINLHTSELTITLATNELQPGSVTRIEIHSEPVEVASVVVGPDGSLAQTVPLPKDLSAGYHTVHIKGTSYTGQPVDYYQTILVASGMPPPALVGIQSTSTGNASDAPSVQNEISGTTFGTSPLSQVGEVKGTHVSAPHASVFSNAPRQWWKLIVAIAFIVAAVTLAGLIIRHISSE
jgi:lysophospholipase L1-like esterase